MAAFFLCREIRAAQKNTAIFGIHLNNEIAVSAFWASPDVMFMNLIIGHEITDFRLIGTYPEIKPIILVELVFQRISADRTAKLEQVHDVHVQLI